MFPVRDVERLFHVEPGGFCFTWCQDGERRYRMLWARLPCLAGGDPVRAWPIGPDKPRDGRASWTWDGNETQPSLTPSVRTGARASSNGAIVTEHWHGFVTKGRLESCT